MRTKSVVGRVAVMLLLVVACARCASTNTALVATDAKVHDSLAKADDKIRAFCSNPANSPLYQAPCADVRKALLPTIEAGASFNRAVADQKVGELGKLVGNIGDLISEIRKLPSGETAVMITDLTDAILNAGKAAVAAGGK